MGKQHETFPSSYPCLVRKDGLRLVHDPHDERIVRRAGPARRLLAKLVAVVRS